MFCKTCGNKLKDNARFCGLCGAEVVKPMNQEVAQSEDTVSVNKTQQSEYGPKANIMTPPQPDTNQDAKIITQKKSSKNKVLIISIIAAVVVVIAVVAVLLLNGGIFGKSDKGSGDSDYINEVEEFIDDIKDTKKRYYLTEDQEDQINDLIDEIENAISEDKIDKEEIEDYKDSIDELLSSIEEENKTNLEDLKLQVIDAEPNNLFDDELLEIEEYASEFDESVADGEYAKAMDVMDEWQNYLDSINNPSNELQVTVEQYDISELPKVKLYVNVEDVNGDFLHGLDKNAFYVNEQRTVGGEFKRQTLINVAQLNENEGISIGLVADVSGSMSETLPEVKSGIKDFINSVQFEKGDKIELTQFNDNIYDSTGFTNEKSLIGSYVDNMMFASGMTRLYDALISEIERVRACSNAKCVIAFTDGYDNESNYTYQDVIDYACRYNIPVFMIGIGNHCDAATLSKIAEQTGGFYENISDSTTLEDVYNKIYKVEKEVYVIEYETENSDDYESTYNLDVYVRADEDTRGNAEGFYFEPEEFFDVLYNRFLIAGVDCQFKGERNLLDSGLIITSEEAYNNKECVAYQSQESINSGGVGTTRSDIFMILVDYGVLNIHKDGNGYVMYGFCNYDISKVKSYGSITNEKERQKIREIYGDNISDDTMFWIELNITNYERLTVIKDTDGKWKINTRVYEREDGGDTYVVNQVYSVKKQ